MAAIGRCGTPRRSDQSSIRPGSAADFRCASTTRFRGAFAFRRGKNGGATSLIARTYARIQARRHARTHSHARAAQRNASTQARARALRRRATTTVRDGAVTTPEIVLVINQKKAVRENGRWTRATVVFHAEPVPVVRVRGGRQVSHLQTLPRRPAQERAVRSLLSGKKTSSCRRLRRRRRQTRGRGRRGTIESTARTMTVTLVLTSHLAALDGSATALFSVTLVRSR